MVLGEEAEQRILFYGRRNVGATVSAEGADRGASLALAKAGGQAARVLDDGDCGDVRRAKLSGYEGQYRGLRSIPRWSGSRMGLRCNANKKAIKISQELGLENKPFSRKRILRKPKPCLSQPKNGSLAGLVFL